MKLKAAFFSAAITISFAQQANALNIVLTNDDGYATENIQTLFTKLTEAGHDVIMSAPCTGQSGKGGAVNFVKPVNVQQITQDQHCVGDTDETVPFKDFVEGTPVMAALYGIDVLAKSKWEAAPDLVISGPNEGNNLGYLTNNSGTLGAANIAIARGIPAIAVSAATEDAENAELVADAVLEIVDELIKKQGRANRLLPEFTGLNVNTPEDMSAHKGYKFSQVGWDSANIDPVFMADLSQDDQIMAYVAQGILAAGYAPDFETALQIAKLQYAGKAGISVDRSGTLVVDDHPYSEGNLWAQGYITISTIEANVQATFGKSLVTRFKLKGLQK